ncbi:DUF4192 domain-containing protein [Nocardioides sp.]|uniref:DUF4192 domain-containing protein n=1 Tax=Nocardioides sp. TaxID=35761 RepID=UPI0027336E58|nr:DUF4192 domain-containing protein [Nocardioides sp.]MDP3890693.1 DUF4192 domain-containing protein [Nocardioides sp.]
MTSPNRTLRARTPEDVLAVVPVVLGFVPTDSVVMLTFGAASPFHARIDLPDDAGQVPHASAALVAPAVRHGVERVVLVIYSRDPLRAREAFAELAAGFEGARIAVAEALLADGRCWFPLLPGRPAATYAGVPYDVSHHPLSVQAVVDGRVTHASREALAATLAGVGAAEIDRVRAEVGQRPELDDDQRAAEGSWVRAQVRQWVVTGEVPAPAALARLLVALTDIGLRDVAWLLMSRADAARHVDWWVQVVRRAPGELAAAPAALLAFAAWLAGEGALAWCAVDRSRESDPDYRLAELVAQALTHAVPPSTWEPVDESELPAPDPA